MTNNTHQALALGLGVTQSEINQRFNMYESQPNGDKSVTAIGYICHILTILNVTTKAIIDYKLMIFNC